MPAIQVSFVIIEFHCPELVRECVQTIRGHAANLVHEITVSSNSEYDEPQKMTITRAFPGVKWLFNAKNGGFAYAMNRGLEACSGEAAVLVNPDARFIGPIMPALGYLLTHEEVAILGPQIIDKAGNIQDSCRRFMTPLTLFSRLLKRFFLRKDVLLAGYFDYNRIQPVDWVIGACMMLRKPYIDQAGLLDEKYFFYVEDMDICFRAWCSGRQVHYIPEWKVEYKGSRKSTVFFIKKNLINHMSLIHLRSYLRFLFKYSFYFYRRF
ncbi:MAG: glycosyltransferase family 2 protein [Candidatus Aminicenantes bacterium]|nr:glycosyltransferase family 2 protein [Candidatus Aminicenantes bacterium]